MSVMIINPFMVSPNGYEPDGYPTQLIVIGAGTSAVDGTYTRTGGTSGGRPNYAVAGKTITYVSPGWKMEESSTIRYTNATSDPTSVWTTNIGFATNPPPTVSAT